MDIPSINSLHDEKNLKNKSRVDMFTVVLNKCIEKIIYTNRHTDKTFVIFEVPRVLIGNPSYDMKSCIVFLMHKLSQNKYYVEFIEPFYLYIDWGSQNKQSSSSVYKKRESTTKFNEELIEKTLTSPKIEFVYEDLVAHLNKKKKKKKKNAKK